MACSNRAQSESEHSALSPDLVRNEISAGHVKSIVLLYGELGDTCRFTEDGRQIYDERIVLAYDAMGRQVSQDRNGLYANETDDLSMFTIDKDSLVYSGNDFRPKFFLYEQMAGGVLWGSQSYLDHIFYDGDRNYPAAEFSITVNDGNTVDICYAIFRYLKMDEQGNWTEREVYRTMYEFEAEDERIGEIMSLYEGQFDEDITRAELEEKLKKIVFESDDKDTLLLTRKIEYYE